MSVKVTIITENKNKDDEISRVLTYSEPVLLLFALRDAGIYIYAPCGGVGTCGKCHVRAGGDIAPLTAEEKLHLTQGEIDEGIRLACRAVATGDTFVYVPSDAVFDGSNVSHCANIAVRGVDKVSETAQYGLSIDFGTTTVAARLYKLPSGEFIGEAVRQNPQALYGADIISRIVYALSNSQCGDDAPLTRMLHDLTSDIISSFNVATDDIIDTVAVGNTAMLHFYTGLDPSGIASAPFKPQSLFGGYFGRAYIPRCVSSYVGADAIAAAIASGMTEQRCALLCDIGTNCEILLWRNGRLYCCAAAAGPALEGAGISCGMTATSGAIDAAYVSEGELHVHVIGDGKEKAAGICGSGLIAVTSALLQLGIIDESGYMEKNYELAKDVYITPADVRALQLAKAAVRAGIDTLCDGIDMDEIECFYIAGGFGSGLDIDSCVRIGLFPNEIAGRAKIIGNAALHGASMMLIKPHLRDVAARLADCAEYRELSTDDNFSRRFIERISFPHGN